VNRYSVRPSASTTTRPTFAFSALVTGALEAPSSDPPPHAARITVAARRARFAIGVRAFPHAGDG
jgi:hypothetical protein